MDSLEINKVFAAVLVSGIAFMGASLLADGLVHAPRLAKPAIAIDAAPGAAMPAAAVGEPPLAVLLASADPKRGESVTQSAGCVACHSFNEGGKAGVGPNLYGVVGAPHGHMAGYAYSEALKSKQGPWTFAELSEWLKKPAAYAPGTKMSFAGLPDPKKRADVIDYLRTLSANPEKLPDAPAVAAGAAPAPAAGGAPAASGEAASLPALLAAADPAHGQADTAKLGCVACHTFTEGGKAGLGPNLYGVVGAPHGHMEGYAYSSALKSKPGPWNFAELDSWLTKPSAYAPGTKMTFAGVADRKVRADVIVYLRSLSPNPEPLPAAGK